MHETLFFIFLKENAWMNVPDYLLCLNENTRDSVFLFFL